MSRQHGLSNSNTGSQFLTGELFDYVIEHVNVNRKETTGGTIHDPWHHPPTTPKTSPHPGMFLSTNVDLLEQLLAHKELFRVFVDHENVERIAKLMKAMSAVC